MQLLEKFAQWLVKKTWGGFGPDRWFPGEHAWFGRTAAGVVVNPETAMTQATAFACVRLLASSIASLPCYVMRSEGRSKLKAPEHALWPILLEQPNDFQTSFTFWQHVMTHVLLEGNLYAYIQRNGQGDVIALWPLRRGTVVVENDKGRMIYHYVWGDTKTVFDGSEILHFKNLSLNGFVGMSTLQAAREALGEALAQGRHSSSLWRNSARPSVVLKIPNVMNVVQREQFRESFKARFSGALNAGEILLLEGGMDLGKAETFSNEDAEFLKSREFSVRDVARFFGVPAHLVGDTTRTSYGSAEVEALSFLTHSLRPWLVNFEQEINSKLLPKRTKFFARFDATEMMRGEMATRYEAYAKALGGGSTQAWATVADIREWENLPFIPGTDQLSTPLNVTAPRAPERTDPSATIDPAN
jgi:HK97 family phage portal protein